MSKSPEEENSYKFFQDLNVKFVLEADGKKAELLANSIEKIKFDLHTYGYDALVHFRTFDEDDISQLFALKKMIQATLTFTSSENTSLLELKGIVYKRSFESQGKQIQKKKSRLFKVRFTDPAKLSWNNHYPTKIFVEETMKNVIEAEKNPLITLKYDWEALNETHPIIAYSLPKHKQASFYSFLMWHLEQAGGIFEYNYKEHSYAILGKKSEEGKPVTVPEWETRFTECGHQEPERHHKRTIQHSPESVDQQDEQNPEGLQAVRSDAFDDTKYPLYPEKLTKATLSILAPEKPIIQFNLARLLETFNLDQITPGALMTLQGDKTIGGNLSEEPEVKDQEFRLRDVSFDATKNAVSDGVKKPVQPFRVEIRLTAEAKDESFVSRPAFTIPVYPFFMDGKIFSEIGDKEQTTHNLVKNDKMPMGHYQVVVPLAGMDKKVPVPYTSDGINGQNYQPHTKNLDVLLAMHFQAAKLVEVIGLNDLAQAGADVQIHRRMLASNGKDKYLKEEREYKGQELTYRIEHSTSAEQKQLFEIPEQKMLLSVAEKGKTLALIEISRQPLSVTVQVKDDDQGTTQQIVLSPKGNVITAEGKDGKTTITQTSNTVSIETDKYMVKCKEAIIDAEKTITCKAGSKHIIDAPLTTAKKFKAN